MDREKLQAEAIEDIRKVLYEPKITLPQARRRIAHIIKNLREALGETPETTIIRTSDRPSVREIADRMVPKRDA